MTSRVDYCNALLGGCSARLINKLQLFQNAAARVFTRTRNYGHISPVLSTLHWLPIKHRIHFKILLITYKALNGSAPQYLSELLSHYSPSRLLRSQNSGNLIIPRTELPKLQRGKAPQKPSKSFMTPPPNLFDKKYIQGSRVRLIWLHLRPNFSMVRQKKAEVIQPFEKKKSLCDSESLPGVQQQTHIRPIS